MQVIDNKREKVGEVLTQHITRETELSVITSLFSIYAFAMLENNLPLINKLRLLFSKPLDISDKLTFIGMLMKESCVISLPSNLSPPNAGNGSLNTQKFS